MLVGMDSFLVFVAPPRQRARIHRESCGFCQERRRGIPDKRKDGPTFWSPTFQSYLAADIYMREEFGHFHDIGDCKACQPQLHIPGRI